MPPRERLWAVMPAYNEEDSVERVLGEWLPALRALEVEFRLLAINDGSRDSTLARLRRVAEANSEVEVIDQPHRGHGGTCLEGYRRALAADAAWVFQLDSDGQCDPRFLATLWSRRALHAAVFGYRGRRDDGWLRWAISRAVSLAVFLGAAVWVADANVPYRLMRRDALAVALDRFPPEFHLVNVLVAVRLRRTCGIRWEPIHFRRRFAGTPTVRTGGFLRQGAVLVRQLRKERRR